MTSCQRTSDANMKSVYKY